MAASKRVRRRPMSDINVVPYIDVMLVLLIVFMVTAPLLTQGLNVELPNVVSDPLEIGKHEPIIVSVDSKGGYYLELGEKRDSAQSLTAIKELVQKVLLRSPQTPVLVNGDRDVKYGAVVELMATLQGAGVPNLGLLTEPPK